MSNLKVIIIFFINCMLAGCVADSRIPEGFFTGIMIGNRGDLALSIGYSIGKQADVELPDLRYYPDPEETESYKRDRKLERLLFPYNPDSKIPHDSKQTLEKDQPKKAVLTGGSVKQSPDKKEFILAKLRNPFLPEYSEPKKIDLGLDRIDSKNKQRKIKKVYEVIDDANEESSRKPSMSGYQNSIAKFSYNDGLIYRIFVSPGHITDLRLQKFEKMLSISAGNTEGFMINHIATDVQERILIKPLYAKIETNLVITTDKRTYYFMVKAFRETFMMGVSFNYPKEELEKKKALEAKNIKEKASKLRAEDCNYDYEIESKCNNCIAPLSVFDNGEKIFIVMPEEAKYLSLPVLFTLNNYGIAEVINYRFLNNKFIIDSIYNRLVLQYGDEKRRVLIYKLGFKPESKKTFKSFFSRQ